MATKKEGIKYLIEADDKASSVFQKVARNAEGAGRLIAGAGAVAATALFGIGAGLAHMAAEAEPLVGIRQAFNNLTADVKGGSAGLLSSLTETSAGWITQADLMKNFNLAASLVSKDFAMNLPEAMGYLTKVASATGTDMNYMLDSLVRGVGRLSPLILDNLGIQASLSEATERAAEMFGKEAEELTKAEQQAGMFNVIMEKLKENTKDIELPEKSFASFKVKLQDLHHEIGEKLVPILSPFVDMLSELADVVGEWLMDAFEKLEPIIAGVATAFGHFFDNLKAGQDPLSAVEGLVIRLAGLLGLSEGAYDDLGDSIHGVFEGLRDFIGKAEEFIEKVGEWLQPVFDWIKANIELKDVLLAVGIVLAAFVLPIVLSIAAALAPIILTFLALVAIIALVRKAWETDWLGIRTKLTEAWESTIKPALEQLWAWLQEKIPQAIETLKGFWENTLLPALQTVGQFIEEKVVPVLIDVYNWLKENIPIAIAAAKEYWENQLKPALETVWEFIQTKVIPVIKDVCAWLEENIPIAIAKAKDFWENHLQPALKKVWDFIDTKIIPIFEKVGAWLGEKIPEVVEKCREFWEEKLKPALEIVWQFIDEHVLPLLKDLWEFIDTSLNLVLEILAGLWENVLKPALEKVWEVIEDKVLPVLKSVWEWIKDKLTPVIEPAKNALDRLKGALDKVGDVLDWVRGLIQRVTDALKNVKLPDWLVGHSPSPFENTLAGIHAGLSAINRDLVEANERFNALGRDNMIPTLAISHGSTPAGYEPAGAGRYVSDRTYNLTIITSGDIGRLEQQFDLMEAWAGA